MTNSERVRVLVLAELARGRAWAVWPLVEWGRRLSSSATVRERWREAVEQSEAWGRLCMHLSAARCRADEDWPLFAGLDVVTRRASLAEHVWEQHAYHLHIHGADFVVPRWLHTSFGCAHPLTDGRGFGAAHLIPPGSESK